MLSPRSEHLEQATSNIKIAGRLPFSPFIHLTGVMSGHCEINGPGLPSAPHPLERESKSSTFSPKKYADAAIAYSLTPHNFILCLHNHCFTLASIFGGKGRPVMTTARPFISAKSSPSLTYTNVKNTYKIRGLKKVMRSIIHTKKSNRFGLKTTIKLMI